LYVFDYLVGIQKISCIAIWSVQNVWLRLITDVPRDQFYHNFQRHFLIYFCIHTRPITTPYAIL
jgi:hypothetical protein